MWPTYSVENRLIILLGGGLRPPSDASPRSRLRRRSRRSDAANPDALLDPSVVHPFLHESGVALALARHLRPAREQPRRGEEETIAQVGGVVAVLLERRVRDLLVVRIVLELARGDRDRRHVRGAIGAGLQVRAGQRGRARGVEGENGVVQLRQQRVR